MVSRLPESVAFSTSHLFIDSRMPDMVILNSADSDIFLKINNLSYVVVQPDGKVSYIYSASNLRTRCTMQVYKFPFEKNR